MRSRKKPARKPLRVQLNKKTALVIAGAVLVLAAAASILAYRNLTGYRFSEPAVYSVMDLDFDVPAGSVARVDKEGKTMLKIKDGSELSAEEAGIFFVDTPKMLTIKPMSYYRANQTDILEAKQITPLTEVQCEYGVTTFQKNAKKLEEEGDFLFDGDNTYITLRDAVLVVGDEKIADLTALSYVICSYRNWVAYKVHGSGTYVYLPLSEEEEYREVKINFLQDNVSVICDRDRVTSPYDDFMLTSAVSRLEEALK